VLFSAWNNCVNIQQETRTPLRHILLLLSWILPDRESSDKCTSSIVPPLVCSVSGGVWIGVQIYTLVSSHHLGPANKCSSLFHGNYLQTISAFFLLRGALPDEWMGNWQLLPNLASAVFLGPNCKGSRPYFIPTLLRFLQLGEPGFSIHFPLSKLRLRLNCYRRSVGQCVLGLLIRSFYCQTFQIFTLWGALADERTGL
jgi:hypothetical protein